MDCFKECDFASLLLLVIAVAEFFQILAHGNRGIDETLIMNVYRTTPSSFSLQRYCDYSYYPAHYTQLS